MKERKKEERGLGVERLRQDALPERASAALQIGQRNRLIFSGVEDHANAEKAQVRRAQVFNDGKRGRRLRENDGNAGGRRHDMHQPAAKCTERREETFAASPSQRASQHVKHAGTGSNSEQNSGTQKNQETNGVEHDWKIIVR